MEGTFLIRDAITSKGYEAVSFPKELRIKKTGGSLRSEGKTAQTYPLIPRNSGAQAIIFARGSHLCSDMESCVAKVEILLVDASSGEELWKSRARGTTGLSQGDEMKAAVQGALEEFPDNFPVSG